MSFTASFFKVQDPIKGYMLHLVVTTLRSPLICQISRPYILLYFILFVFHGVGIFKDHRPAVLQYVPQSGFACFFATIRFRVNTSGKNSASAMLYSFCCIRFSSYSKLSSIHFVTVGTTQASANK